jgi:hypothetical protein
MYHDLVHIIYTSNKCPPPHTASPALDVYEVEHETRAERRHQHDDHDQHVELQRPAAVLGPLRSALGVVQDELRGGVGGGRGASMME